MQRGELSSGDRCEAYRIVRLIAAGGTGEVYEAVHEPTGQIVAIKCLKITHCSKEDARARMKMEAVVLSELKHANLVRVYDAGVHERGTIWIAMERLQGKTLREIVYQTGRIPVPEALHYASEVAEGVDAVHAVNVIHRDLKPENVFITHLGHVKVLDLGTGKFTGYGLRNTDRMRIVGTTAYMAPEQIKNLPLDGRADIYALGLMIHEMLTGRHALLDADRDELPDNMERLVSMQLQVQPAPLTQLVPDVPPYIDKVVMRAIAKDRDHRHSTMGELARDLRACRKRYIAESHAEAGIRGSHPPVADLREKLGARIPSNIPLERPNRRAEPTCRARAPLTPVCPTLRAVGVGRAAAQVSHAVQAQVLPAKVQPDLLPQPQTRRGSTSLGVGIDPAAFAQTVPTELLQDLSVGQTDPAESAQDILAAPRVPTEPVQDILAAPRVPTEPVQDILAAPRVPTEPVQDISAAPRIPTEQLQAISVPFRPEAAVHRDRSHLPSVPLPVRTTNTNPLWPISSRPDQMVSESRSSSVEVPPDAVPLEEPAVHKPTRSHARRLGWTVLLGTALGLPPALFAIWLTRPRTSPISPQSSPVTASSAWPPSSSAHVERTPESTTVFTSPSGSSGKMRRAGVHDESGVVEQAPAPTQPSGVLFPGGKMGAGYRTMTTSSARTERLAGPPLTAPSASAGVLVSPEWVDYPTANAAGDGH